MLETYDPKWADKWDLIHVRVKELEAIADKRMQTSAEAAEHENLANLLCRICDASFKTANDYIAVHLSLTLREAARLGLKVTVPVLPDDADYDTVQAAVAKVNARVKYEQDRRKKLKIANRLEMTPEEVFRTPYNPDGTPRHTSSWAPPAKSVKIPLTRLAVIIISATFRTLVPRWKKRR